MATKNLTEKSNEKQLGRVKWFCSWNGFGFIGRDNGQPDIFVHKMNLMAKNRKAKLSTGDLVEFEIGRVKEVGFL